MARRLIYFNINGRAEPIRYMLHYGRQKFEDVRYDKKSWPIKTIKESLPYAQLPVYEEGNRRLDQSLAIARYVASQNNLLPADPWEQAVLDAAVLNMYDFWAKISIFVREQNPVKKESLKKDILNENIDFFFSRFDKELKAKEGFFGAKLSWADFILVGVTEGANFFLEEEIQKKYPAVESLIQKVRALPGVKDYIATRKPYIL